jgi:hypothetical protein
MKIWISLGFVAIAASLVGCAPAHEEETDAVSEDTQDLSSSPLSTYYVARRDLRKCVSPLCGGYFVSRVNFATTRCADGSNAAACYVTDLDLSKLGLSDATVQKIEDGVGTNDGEAAYVFRGTMSTKSHGSFGKLGYFKATEAWAGPELAPTVGTFYKLSDAQIRCITVPCPNIRERKLNSTAQPKNIAEIDLSGAPGTSKEKAHATQAIFDGAELIAVGTNSGQTLAASTYFERLVPRP